MNKDIRLKVTFPNHKKTIKLIHLAGHESFYSLVQLWCYVAQNHPEGLLNNYDKDDIEIASRWNSEKGLFVKSILKVGFLKKIKNGFEIHEWEEHNPYAFYAGDRSKKAKEAARSRWGRADGDQGNLTRAERMKIARSKSNHKDSEWHDLRDFFNTCVKCNGKSGLERVDRDHIIPVHMGGCHGIRNIQPLCAKCNASKSNDTNDYRFLYCEDQEIKLNEHWDRNLCTVKDCAMLNVCLTPASSRQQKGLTSPPSPDPSPLPLPTPKPVFSFDDIWKRYPNKDSRGKAEKSFIKFVTTEELYTAINKALDNYIDMLKVETWRKPQSGSTWFNNWKDWIDYKAPVSEIRDIEIIIDGESQFVTDTEYKEWKATNGK